MRLVDADELNKVKFHPLPYTHIVPADLLKCQTEAYERGWNDAIDSIMENAPTVDAVPLEDYRSMEQTVNKLTKAIAKTVDPVKHGHWIEVDTQYIDVTKCSNCGVVEYFNKGWKRFNYCPNCGAKMEEVEDE